MIKSPPCQKYPRVILSSVHFAGEAHAASKHPYEFTTVVILGFSDNVQKY